MIILLLALMPLANAQESESIKHKIMSNMRDLCTAVKLFKLDTSRFPDINEGLAILLPNAGGMSAPSGIKPTGYIDDVFLDPWGREYQYVEVETGYRVLTYGANGIPGGTLLDEDVIGCDLNNPNKLSKVDAAKRRGAF